MMIHPNPNPLRLDPTRSLTLRRAFSSYLTKAYRTLKGKINELFRTEAEHITNVFEFRTTSEQVDAFERWLDAEMPDFTGDSKIEGFIQQGYEAGQQKAFARAKVLGITEGNIPALGITREGFLRSSFLQPVSVDKVRLLTGRVFTDLKNVNSAMSSQMTRTLAEGFVRGDNPRVIARALNKAVDGIGRHRSSLIARTETIRAHAEGSLDTYEQMGVKNVNAEIESVSLLTASDDRVCQQCSSLSGQVFTLSEASGVIPVHPLCVTGDSLIVADDVLSITKTHYTGEIIEFRTANGRRLTVTPNHILLTEFGFIPARFIYKGLNIVSASTFEPPLSPFVFGSTPDNDANIASISDVFAAFSEDPTMMTMSVPVAPEDLHGDGGSCDKEVSIIFPDSKLWDETEVGQIKKDVLPFIQFVDSERVLDGFGSVTQSLHGMANTFDSSMGIFRDLLAILLGHLLHSHKHGLGPTTRLDPSIIQSSINNASANPELFRECISTHPILKQLDDFSIRELMSIAIKNKTSIRKSPMDGLGTDSEMFSQITLAHVSGVKFDEVVDVNVKSRSHDIPVFDVHTKSSLYKVNGLVSSNCRCSWLPVV